jgi:hypothetical protein
VYPQYSNNMERPKIIHLYWCRRMKLYG